MPDRISRDAAEQATPCDASVVICAHTLDRWDEIVRAVASVRAQTLPAREIVVVIDHNDALLAWAAAELEGAVVIPNARTPGLSGARMTGADRAVGAVIAFLDDDAAAAPDWLEQLMPAYRDPAVIGAGGPVEPLWKSGRPAWFPAEFLWVVGCTYLGMDVRDGRIRNPVGANMSVLADVLRGAGGFTSELGRRKLGFSVSGRARIGGKAESCEETEFCIRTARLNPGGHWAYRPGARVGHSVPAQRATWRYFVQRCLIEGTAKAVLRNLAGSRDGLGAEGRYVREVLPAGVLRELGLALRGDLGALGRAGAIVAGLSLTAFAYLAARAGGSAVKDSDAPGRVDVPVVSK